MAMKMFDQLPQEEQDDFVRACARRAHSYYEFRVHVGEHRPREGEGPFQRDAFVQRISTSFGKRYRAEPGINWTAAFERDVLKGTFD